MDIPWSEVASFSAAALSAVAAAGAWMAARRSNATADAVAAIERDRWHADLTPEFEITLGRSEGDRRTLDVQLVGPLPLRRLDSVAISIGSSDDAERTDRLPGGPSQEEIDAQVWGPYRFTHGADGADTNGHTVQPVPMEVGRGRPFSVERTRPPYWQEGNDREERWRDQWLGKPIKLVLTCRRDGFAPWVVPYEIDRSIGGAWAVGGAR